MIEGTMIILSSPSGAGKTTLVKLLSERKGFVTSISHTTRKPRPNEVDGVDYHFVSKEKFSLLLKESAFYEHAQIFGNFYGTSKTSIKKITNNNHNVLFDIDWQGSEQLSKFKELNLVKVFILPPSKEELEKRLIERGLNSKDDLKERIKKAKKEIEMKSSFDYSITNDDLDMAKSEIIEIVKDFLNK